MHLKVVNRLQQLQSLTLHLGLNSIGAEGCRALAHRRVPQLGDVTPRLIGGAALFGIGWGIAGLCPGPGIAALVIEPGAAAIFVAAMLAGMALVRLFEAKSA